MRSAVVAVALLAASCAAGSSTALRRSPLSSSSSDRTADAPLQQRLPNGVRHILAGAASGALGVTALAPLEVVRVNMLLNRDWSLATAIGSLKAGWFRGNTPDVIAAAARVGITMPAFAFYKRKLQQLTAHGGDTTLPPPKWTIFLAGALAGCTASIACFPLEVARTRLAVACDLRMGMLGCFVSIWREEGALALYAGLLTTLAGVLPFNAIKLTAYDVMRGAAVASSHDGDERSVSLPLQTVAAIGASSGMLAATSCFPFEVVRRRQMAGELAGVSAYGAIARIVQSEGAAALMKGSGLNCLKVAMSNSIGFVLYELAKDVLCVDGRSPPWAKATAT